MKDAVMKGMMEGFVVLTVLALYLFVSVGMAEVGKIYPYVTIAFYISFLFSIPITFNILSFRRDEKKKNEEITEKSLSEVS